MPAQYFNRERLKETLRRDFPLHTTLKDGYVGYGRLEMNKGWTNEELLNMNLDHPDQFTEITAFQAELPLDNDIRRARYRAESVIGVRYFYNNLNPVRQEVILNLIFDYNIQNWVEPFTRNLQTPIIEIRKPVPNYTVLASFLDAQGESARWDRLSATMLSGDEADLELSKTYDGMKNIFSSLALSEESIIESSILTDNPALAVVQKKADSIKEISKVLAELGLSSQEDFESAIDVIEETLASLGLNSQEDFKKVVKVARKVIRGLGIESREDFRNAVRSVRGILSNLISEASDDETDE